MSSQQITGNICSTYRPSLQSFDLFRTINHDLYIDDSGPRKIDCGLKEIDADKYKRNYEVKGKAVNNLNDSLAFKWNTSEVTLVKGAWSLLFNPLSRGQSFTYPLRPPLPQAQTQILMLRIFLTTSGSLTAELAATPPTPTTHQRLGLRLSRRSWTAPVRMMRPPSTPGMRSRGKRSIE